MNEQINEQAQAATSAPEAAKPAKAPKAKAKKPAKAKAKAKKPAKKAKSGETVKGPQILRQYAPKYHKDTERKTAGGHVSVDNDDKVAKKLRGMTLDAVYAEAAKVVEDKDGNKLTVKALKEKYKHLNVGMQRMNLGNRIRAALA